MFFIRNAFMIRNIQREYPNSRRNYPGFIKLDFQKVSQKGSHAKYKNDASPVKVRCITQNTFLIG
jgi:hypothetical protein